MLTILRNINYNPFGCNVNYSSRNALLETCCLHKTLKQILSVIVFLIENSTTHNALLGSKMVKEIKRSIKRTVERELWARSGGRCQFNGHNKLLYKSSVTQERVNIAQQAHIYSFSEKGPRGRGPFAKLINRECINDVGNLMLMCHECHTTIDQDKSGEKYSADLLIRWKHEHEQRVEIVTNIKSDKKSHVVLYGANIGSEKSPIHYYECAEAMFPDSYPESERPIILSMNSALKDNSSEYWASEPAQLSQAFDQGIAPLIAHDDCKNFSVFALAPQPLLIKLGTLFTDKISVDTFQLHRKPKGWRWKGTPDNFSFKINRPETFDGEPALLISLSDKVSKDRITNILGDDTPIWEITIENPYNDFMQSTEQLALFGEYVRKVMVEIKDEHGHDTPLHIFPVMPVSCCIEFGRARMPKAEMPWIIYDKPFDSTDFTRTIELNGNEF